MKKILMILVAALLIMQPCQAKVSHPFHIHYSHEEGLPRIPVTSICQDSYGRIWVATRNGLFYSSGQSFSSFRNKDFLSTCSSAIIAIEEDRDHNIWIVTSQGVGYYNPETDEFIHIADLDAAGVSDIDSDPDGFMLIASRTGIWKYNLVDKTLEKASDISSASVISRMSDHSFAILSNGGEIMTSDEGADGISQLDVQGHTFSTIAVINSSSLLAATKDNDLFVVDVQTGRTRPVEWTGNRASRILSLMVFGGEYWIGTNSGIIVYDPRTGMVDDQTSISEVDSSVRGQVVLSLFHDKDGNVWAGMFNGGVRCFRNYYGKFGRLLLEDCEISSSLRAVCVDSRGMVWLGGKEGTLVRFNPVDNTTDDFTSRLGLPVSTMITDLKQIDGDLYILTNGSSILVFDPVRQIVTKIIELPGSAAMSICRGRNGNVYVGMVQGLYMITPYEKEGRIIDGSLTADIHALAEDKKGNLWIGTNGDGLAVLTTEGEFRIVDTGDKDVKFINDICWQRDGTLWVGTDGGGISAMRFSDDFTLLSYDKYKEEEGVSISNVSSMVSDDDGNMWLLVSDGIVKFNMSERRAESKYFASDKVIGPDYYSGKLCVADDGTIYVAVNKGMIYFAPVDIDAVMVRGRLMVSVYANTAGTMKILSQEGRSPVSSEVIKLKKKDAQTLGIFFTTTGMERLNENIYDCSLKKFNFHSELTTNRERVFYPGLKAGRYVFTVKIHGSDDPQLTESVKIVVKAPWYNSVFAWVIYIMLILFAVNASVKNYNSRKSSEYQSNVLQDKMTFMTNVAHEIKTPVSLITILADKIADRNAIALDDEARQDILSLKGSSGRLLELCNDLLDIRKLEEGRMELVYRDEDFLRLVSDTVRSFGTAAKSKGISLSAEYPEGRIMVPCDRKAVNTILSNLLSNAMKYCSSQIKVSVVCDAKDAKLIVSSDGARIPDAEREKIFEAFYQSRSIESKGYGIGLAFAKSLAVMHGWGLSIDNSDEEFNSFVLSLSDITRKIDAESMVDQEYDATESADIPMNDIPVLNGKPSVLVVEDDITLRNAISEGLSSDYNISVAGNGEQALEILRKENIDLVVSDIMMPVMDGCVMCNTIKEDLEMSHILVILLTAVIGAESHIRSLKAGADSYMEKPFKMEVLKANISSLLKNRDIRNEQFARSPLGVISFTSSSSIERDFMNKLHETLLEHLSEDTFSAGMLPALLNINRKTLSAKIRANTGLSTTEYIRICRLKKAAELLTENKYKVNEVAYLVGYSTPSYFTQHFQKQFGVKPSDYVKNLNVK